MRQFLATILVGLGLCHIGAEAFALDEIGYDLIVIGGQSNATGVGRGEFHDAAKSEMIDGKIFQLGRDIPGCRNDQGKVIPATETLEHWKNCPDYKTVGFGMAFARRWALNQLAPNRKVLLIPGALGGTTAQQWQEGLWPALKTQVSEGLKVGNGKNRVVALLWSQGEGDFALCTFQPASEICRYTVPSEGRREDIIKAVGQAWRDRLVEMFNDFQKTFDPEGKVVILATGFVAALTELRTDKDPSQPCRSRNGITLDDPNCYTSFSVQAEKIAFEDRLLEIQKSRLVNNFSFIPTTGITCNGEVGAWWLPKDLPLHYNEGFLHFSAQGQTDLGEHMWQAFLKNQKTH